MTAIARGEENITSNINWFITVNGNKTNMYAVEFRIFNIEGGLPGDQVFPSSDWEDVTDSPGRFETGSYYAYDNTNTQGWTPELDATLGTHRIYWRWKYLEGSDWQTGAEDFELLDVEGLPGEYYITVDDVRAEGLTAEDFPDATVNAAITTWQSALERACRQWFYSRSLTISFDGDDTDTIHLGVPIITCDYLRINSSTTDLDTDLYKVYNSRTYPDDRRNPRVKLIRSEDTRSVFTAPYSPERLKFVKGYQNQIISGDFGFTESDGSTPLLIKRALLKLVIEKLTNPLYVPLGGSAPAPAPLTIAGVVVEERTDGHMIKYASSSMAARRVGLSGLTGDQEILDIIKLYKAPIGIATPSNWSYY